MSLIQPRTLDPGLYLVATPIGSARDITLHALDVLASADVIAAEDTRNARKLMDIHGVQLGARPLLAYHDHNGPRVRPQILAHIAAGRSVAYVSDAGTPLIADPGYALVNEVRDAGFAVTSAPGPSAVITALSIAGLPTDQFHFAGFLPSTSAARRTALAELATVPGTLVFYETAKRLDKALADIGDVLGKQRDGAICRELTKKFEEVRRGRLGELAEGLAEAPVRGEVVLLVGKSMDAAGAEDMEAALEAALETMRVRDAADAVAASLGLPRRTVYQAALELQKRR